MASSNSTSREQILDYPAFDVRQTHVASGMEVRQERMVEAQEVQDGGMQVMDVDLVFYGRVAEIVGRPRAPGPP